MDETKETRRHQPEITFSPRSYPGSHVSSFQSTQAVPTSPSSRSEVAANSWSPQGHVPTAFNTQGLLPIETQHDDGSSDGLAISDNALVQNSDHRTQSGDAETINELPRNAHDKSVTGNVPLHNSESEDDLFFPRWADGDFERDLSQAVPLGQLNTQTRFNIEQPLSNYSDATTDAPLLRESDATIGSLVTRSPAEKPIRATNQRYSLSSSDPHKKLFRFPSHQNSEITPGVGLRSVSRGSSVFGSGLFESTSSCDDPARVEVLCAESGSVDPTLDIGCFYVRHSRETPDADQLTCRPPQTNNDDDDTLLAVAPLSAGDAKRTVAIPIGPNGKGVPPHWALASSPVLIHATVIEDARENNSHLSSGESDTDDLDLSAHHFGMAAIGKSNWLNAMPDLVENLEMTSCGNELVGTKAAEGDATESALLRHGSIGNRTMREDSVRKDGECVRENLVVHERAEKRRYMKNLLVVSLSFFLIFTSFLSIRNLQTSLNAAGGLGLYALSSVYAFIFIGSLFSTTIVQRLGPKRSLSVSMLVFVLYNVVNFYPRFYTLVPMSAAIGFSLAVLWTSQATYLTNIAIGYARLTNSRPTDVLGRFNGIFFAFFQFSQIAGGLISSLLLQASRTARPDMTDCTSNGFGNQTGLSDVSLAYNVSGVAEHNNVTMIECSDGNLDLCGALYCPGRVQGALQAKNNAVDPTVVLILMGIFLATAIAGLLTLVLLLDPLEGIMKKTDDSVLTQMTGVFRLLCDRHAVYLAYSFYSLLQVSFMFGEFTKAFVTCSVGIHMVGYIMLTVSLSSAISSFATGSIQKYVGRIAINITGLLIQLVLLVLLFFWESTQQHLYLFFIFAALWGTADGIIGPQIVSLIGVLFSSNREVGFSAHKMFQSLSVFVMFITAPYLCTRIRVVFIGCALLIAITGYGVLEVMLKTEKKKIDDVGLQKSVSESDEKN